MDRKETLIFRDCICWNQKLFFFTENINLLIIQNLEGNDGRILPYDEERSYFDLEICVGNIVYALEVNGRNMIRYDLKTNNYSLIQIDCNYGIDANFAYFVSDGKNVYIFTRKQKELVIYDGEEDTVRRVRYPCADDCYTTGCSIGNKYLIFPQNGTCVLEYNADENIWSIQYLSIHLINCVHAMVENDCIYILLASGKVLKWDYNSKEFEVIVDAEKMYAASNAAARLCVTDEEIIILPAVGQDIIKINRKNNKTYIYKDYPKDFVYDLNKKNWSKYYGYCENDIEYYFACRTSKYILKINKKNGEISWIKSEIDRKKLLQVFTDRNDIVLFENPGDLEVFIQLKNKEKVMDKKEINNGYRIWKEIGQC